MKKVWTGGILWLLLAATGCTTAHGRNQLQVMTNDATSMTVHDIRDGEPFVSSGIRICTTEPGTVTVTDVKATGQHHGLVVTDFETFLARPTDQSVPLSLRGRLREVTARTGDQRVEDPCADKSDATDETYIGWEVSGAGAGPGSAEQFTVSYTDEDGRTGQVDVRVGIILCDPAEVAGPCAA